MNNFPEIRTNRLLLRAIGCDDVPAVFEVFACDEVTEHYDCFSFTEMSQAHDWVANIISAYEHLGSQGFRWAICLQENPAKLIGSCGFHSVNPEFRSCDIGYELHPDFWGQGFATEAVAAIIQYSLSHNFPVSINRVAATTDVVSPKSISVLSKLGFKEEGILREYGYWKERFHDVRLFSLLRADWKFVDGITHN